MFGIVMFFLLYLYVRISSYIYIYVCVWAGVQNPTCKGSVVSFGFLLEALLTHPPGPPKRTNIVLMAGS